MPPTPPVPPVRSPFPYSWLSFFFFFSEKNFLPSGTSRPLPVLLPGISLFYVTILASPPFEQAPTRSDRPLTRSPPAFLPALRVAPFRLSLSAPLLLTRLLCHFTSFHVSPVPVPHSPSSTPLPPAPPAPTSSVFLSFPPCLPPSLIYSFTLTAPEKQHRSPARCSFTCARSPCLLSSTKGRKLTRTRTVVSSDRAVRMLTGHTGWMAQYESGLQPARAWPAGRHSATVAFIHSILPLICGADCSNAYSTYTRWHDL
ncbi:hypothetical protein B0H10DRAFT_47567 [Mycena sp. CBHHK59/15]|nr:hypothetical protein B0H10DRAFT_47567 [Mycena sp. CBHHK59/15]